MSDFPGKTVFLSYASQDAEAARRICEALRADGIEVWFDADGGLEHGDEWDTKIRRQIKECVLFLPLISANTQARDEGYFRLEWELAAERAMSIASGVAFILPVVIDDTREADALVPDRFRKVQWTRLPGGDVPPDVRQRLLKLWSHRVGLVSHLQTHGAAGSSRAAVTATAPAAASRKPYAVIAAIAVAVLAVAGWWLSRGAASRPASTPVVATATPDTKGAPLPASPRAASPANDKPAVTEKSLVVLPLENLSPDPENAFFTDGMHTELINAFSTIPNLKVISRPSSLRFKGSSAPLAEIAREVGVANVATGSVRRENGHVKIQVELRRARDEFLLLTKTYDRELRDVMTIQSEVAQDIARALEIRESSGSFEWARYQTKNPEAYDLYLKAVQRYYAPWGARYLAEAEGCARDFQRVMDLDPSFAAAASFLSRAHTQAFDGSVDAASAAEHARLGRKWAEEFARLMPGGGGDGALALYYLNIEHQPARGLELANNVIRALPNDAAGHYYRGNAFARMGRRAESAEAYLQALTLDPLNATYRREFTWSQVLLRHVAAAEASIEQYLHVAGSRADPFLMRQWRFALKGDLPPADTPGLEPLWLFRLRRFEACVQACDSVRAKTLVGWDAVDNDLWRSRALARLGRTDEAKQSAQQALERIQGVALIGDSRRQASASRVQVFLAMGRVDEALEENARASAGATDSAGNILRNFEMDRAEILARGGRTAECVELLKKLLHYSSGLTVPVLRLDPTWDNLREDPAFKALLADPTNSAPL